MKSKFSFGWNIAGWTCFLLVMFLLLPTMASAQIGYMDATSGFMKEQTFHASQAETVTGASTIIDVGAYYGGILTVQVTAMTGTSPTLDVALQTCMTTAIASCINLQSASQFTATGNQLLQVNGFGRYVRVTWTIGGTTPNVTFLIYGAFKPEYWQPQTGNGDPCENAGIPKSSAVINVSSAATTALVPAFAGKITYVCGITALYTSGTSPTMLFKYGTQTTTACDTGAVNLTGVMSLPATVGQGLITGTGTTQFSTPPGNQLCLVSGGTTPTFAGVLTYVQQ